ncbi:RNA-directed DNA methylation 4-like, partial [Vigna umbellata]|uniref:RNA-directed DNA methylation 4-like n=1 Tax=Vigna umbellata TaxID=87088 RepID=UPI001F5EB978
LSHFILFQSLAKDARFEQIWKRRKGNKGTESTHDKELQEICNFYDIVRVDNEEKKKEVQQQEISLEDQRLLSSYLPLLREFIPNAAEEVEADLIAHLSGHSKGENYVYDLYTVTDEMDINPEDTLASYPLVQVEEEEDYYDGPDDSDYESDDSNAENNPLNDYPDEISEEDEEEVEDSESESEGVNGDASNESSNEDTEHHGFSKDDADPYDEDFDEYEGVCNDEDEDWRWSCR